MKKTISILALLVGFTCASAQAQTTPEPAPAPPATPAVTAPANAHADYVGKYKMEGLPFEYIFISIKEGNLYIEADGREGNITPVADKPETFDASGQAELKFVRDENKKVVKLEVAAMGMTFEGKKEE